MIEVVFISDLHLHPDEHAIQKRFDEFVAWAKTSVTRIYILGDFFHAWPGDDSINDWSRGIARQLRYLSDQGISLFYMHGNRDFLLGKTFAQLAGWTILPEPAIIRLGTERILLAHGDGYCTKDIKHQRFRLITRNCLFSTLFLKVPLKYRQRLVNKVRHLSQTNPGKIIEELDVVDSAVINHMSQYKIKTLIHGHTHKSGVTDYYENNQKVTRYVLSDWDDTPRLLCYDSTKGIYFSHLGEEINNV